MFKLQIVATGIGLIVYAVFLMLWFSFMGFLVVDVYGFAVQSWSEGGRHPGRKHRLI